MHIWTIKMPFPPPGLELSSLGLQTDALTPTATPAHIKESEKQKSDPNCLFMKKLRSISLEIKEAFMWSALLATSEFKSPNLLIVLKWTKPKPNIFKYSL